jgi:hypothetical protein
LSKGLLFAANPLALNLFSAFGVLAKPVWEPHVLVLAFVRTAAASFGVNTRRDLECFSARLVSAVKFDTSATAKAKTRFRAILLLLAAAVKLTPALFARSDVPARRALPIASVPA